jgi:tetratricopeptide (TPR) repeat protein
MTKKKKLKSDSSTLNQKRSAADGGTANRRKENRGKLLNSPFVLRSFLILIFIVAGFSLYSKTLSSPFVFDDIDNITENRTIRLTELTPKNILNTATGLTSNRPVSTLTFALNYYFGRYNPEGYHFVNIVIHILNAILLFIFLQLTFKISRQQNISDSTSRLSAGQWISFLAAVIWLVHPIQTQSVTYIVQRMNSIGATFFILALLCYVMGRTTQLRVKQKSDSRDTEKTEKTYSNRTYLWFAASAVSGLLALGSKESTATLPFFVWLYEWYFFQDLSPKWFKSSLKYIIAVAIIFGVVAFLYLGTDPLEKLSKLRDFSQGEFTVTERALTQTRVVVYYLSLIFFSHPSRLNLDYDFPLSHSLFNPITTLFSLILIIGLIALAIYLAKKERLISFCILWFFGNLVIESSIIPLAIIFEHRNYLPSMLIFLIPVILAYRYIQYDWLKIGLLVILIVGLSVWTYQRNSVWKNELTLWSDIVKKSPNKARPHLNLGIMLSRLGKTDVAITHFDKALQLNNRFAKAHFNLGAEMERQGNDADAVKHYHEAIKIEPNYIKAHNNLGLLLARTGRIEEAFQHYSRILNFNPEYAPAHLNWGVAQADLGKFSQAIAHFEQALKIDPNYADAYYNLAIVLEKQGKINDAIDHYATALEKNPAKAEAHFNLGNIFFKQGNTDDAIAHYKAAMTIRPDFLETISNLALVNVARKDYTEALALFMDILKYRPDDAETHYNIACMYSRLKRKEESIEWLQKAIDKGYANWNNIKTDSDLENIRDTNAYKELVKGH